MDDFAAYLVNVVEELEETHGIDFDTLDPFNEPNTNYWWHDRSGRTAGRRRPAVRRARTSVPPRQDLMIKALQQRLGAAGTTTDVAISAMDETNPSTFVTNWNGWTPEAKSAVVASSTCTPTAPATASSPATSPRASDKPLWMSEVEGNWDTRARASTRPTSTTASAWPHAWSTTCANSSRPPGCSGSPSRTSTTWSASRSSTGAASSSTSTATPKGTPPGASRRARPTRRARCSRTRSTTRSATTRTTSAPAITSSRRTTPRPPRPSTATGRERPSCTSTPRPRRARSRSTCRGSPTSHPARR